MIEIIPEQIDRAFLYFHSAGTDSRELEPYLNELKEQLPHTYIWIGDGFISDSPLMGNNAHYGESQKKYWFMFPMQDACSQESFIAHKEAMGASLLSAGSFVNNMVDQIKSRYKLSADNIVLGGFQHGSSLALASAMMRKIDPLKYVILLEPYLLEAYYLEDEIINQETKVICVDNKHIRERTFNWMGIYTDIELKKIGLNIQSITVEEGKDDLDLALLSGALGILQTL